MNQKADLLKSYSNFQHQQVQGWLSEVAIALILSLHQAQQQAGIQGSIAEIGVHHGRLFILLDLLTQAQEKAIAIDVFEDQHLNVDKSGAGNRAIFLKNIDTYVQTQDNLKVVKTNSICLDGQKIKALAEGKIKIFSIDGSHTPTMTYHDLTTASQSIAEGGIIILDDYFNEEWPGVSQGTQQFFTDHPEGVIIPFAIGGNKVFLSTPSHSNFYRDWLFKNFSLNSNKWRFKTKKDKLFNSDVFCTVAEYRIKYEFIDVVSKAASTLVSKLKRG